MEMSKNVTFNNLLQRSITSVILAPLVLLIVYIGGPLYTATILLIAVLMAFEWNTLTSGNTSKSPYIWKIVGIFYIILPCLSMIWLREQDKGMIIVYWLLGVVWSTDIAAYFVGSFIGGWKIAPSISPNKTWSGLIGGVIASIIVGYITGKISQSEKLSYLILLSIVLSIYSQIGDFIESWIKRKFGVKDSGGVIPGHGGILDRVDGLVPVAPKVVFAILFDQWGLF